MTTRTLRTAALVLWAGLFDYLLISGEQLRFVGTRTEWVVWFGAITLTTIAAGAVYSQLRSRQRPSPAAGRRELLGTLGMLAPILLLLVIPSPQLGAQAAAKKAGTRAALPIPDPGEGGPITLYDVVAASSSREFARNRGLKAGQRVQVDGVVTTAGGAGVPLDLTRFQASCCAADAIPFTARIQTPEDSASFGQDQWLQVVGTLAEEDGTWTVQGEQLTEMAAPSDPYSGY